jgi:hypothetical protein
MERRPNYLNQLTGALLDIWGNVNQNDIRNLILTLPEPCQAVINAKEDNTRFKENNFKFRSFFRFLIFTCDVTFLNFCIFLDLCFFCKKMC